MKGTLFKRYLRGFFTIVLIGSAFLFVGSLYIRAMVIRKLNAQSLLTSSIVLSRPFALVSGVNIVKSKVHERLERLGYQSVQHSPARPGEYQQSDHHLLIYLRNFLLPNGKQQNEQLASFSLDEEGRIEQITDVKFDLTLSSPLYLEGEMLSMLGNSSSRATLPKHLDQFSPFLVGAVIAIEDERFPHHFGIDLIAVGRALATNVQHGEVLQGGSTITQQLAKNLFFTNQRTLTRKLFEAFAAVLLETAYTKKEILEFYMNQVFLGQEGNVAIHGFGEAALAFFGKDVYDLTLSEAATLAGIIKAPSKYSPRRHPDLAIKRRNVVLSQMAELQLITKSEAHQASKTALVVAPASRTQRTAPYFTDYVRREIQSVIESSAPLSDDFFVYSSIDKEHQLCAEKALQQGLFALENKFSGLKRKANPLQGALIAVDPANGEILSWVGGRNYSKNQFDRVSSAFRQPGSAFKPFVYLTALDRSLNSYRVARPTSVLVDEPVIIHIAGSGPWEPKNYDENYRGDVTLREALTYSLNIPTVELAQKVGIEAVAHTAELFGFGENLPAVPSLALGAGEVSPFQLARAYGALASGGLLIELRSILSIVKKDSPRPLYQSILKEERISSEAAVFVLTTILQDVINRGTGAVIRRLGFEGAAAGKTGTSNDTRDSWFAGFTPRLLTVVWVGFDDNAKTGLTGAQGAAPIWAEYMKCAAPLGPELNFIAPPGVVSREIDKSTGLLATNSCPREFLISEIFVQGTEPITRCEAHSSFFNDDRFHSEQSPAQRHARTTRARSGWNDFWNSVWR